MEISMDKLQEMMEALIATAFEKQQTSLVDADKENEKRAKAGLGELPELAALPDQPGAPAEFKEVKHLAGGILRAMAAAKLDDFQHLGLTPHERSKAIAEKVHRNPAVAKALLLGDMDAGGSLQAPEWLPGLIELLRTTPKVRLLQPTTIPLTNGAASISKLKGGATAYYVGESQNITPSQETTGLLQFRQRKLTGLVPISNDLLQAPDASANQVVEEDLRTTLGIKSDWTFIRGPGTEHTPKGLENFVLTANTKAANATINLANVTIDLGWCILRLLEQDVRMLRPGWLMSPRSWHYLMTLRDGNGNWAFQDEMAGGSLFGYPFQHTNQIPSNLGSGSNESKIILADFADVVIAEASSIDLKASGEAAYYDGSNVVAAFSRDETVIRAIEKHDFGLRHDESVAVLSAVKWGA